MTTSDVLIVLALAGAVFATQLGRRRFSWRRALLPLGVLAWGTKSHLHSLPTAEVLRLIAAGSTNAEIAEELCVTEATVKTHIDNIFSKAHLRDRAAAVLYAHSHGLVPDENGA